MCKDIPPFEIPDCKDTPKIKSVILITNADEVNFLGFNRKDFDEYFKGIEIDIPHRVTDNN